jgi:hypothetical protein
MEEEPIWVTSQTIDGSANTRTFPSVNSDTPKEIMATVGCPHQIYTGGDLFDDQKEIIYRAAVSSFTSSIRTLDDIMRCDWPKKDEDTLQPDSEGRLARLVNRTPHC